MDSEYTGGEVEIHMLLSDTTGTIDGCSAF